MSVKVEVGDGLGRIYADDDTGDEYFPVVIRYDGHYDDPTTVRMLLTEESAYNLVRHIVRILGAVTIDAATSDDDYVYDYELGREVVPT